MKLHLDKKFVVLGIIILLAAVLRLYNISSVLYILQPKDAQFPKQVDVVRFPDLNHSIFAELVAL